MFSIGYAICSGSVIVALRRVFYIMPYFISVTIMQALTPRGEAYQIMGFYLDKQGIDTTLIYFLRFTTLLYFLGIVFKLSSYILLPQNKIGKEIIRLIVFFKILRKNFFRCITPIRDKNITNKQKFAIVKCVISNVYISTFKNYPYNEYISLYYSRGYAAKKVSNRARR